MNKHEVKKIVFVNQSTGFLTIDVVNEFAKEFDAISLIYGTMTPNKYQLSPKVNRVRVMGKTRAHHFGRFVRWMIASTQIFWLLITRFRNHEVFFYSLPPFAYLGAYFFRRKFSIMVFDVYPDVLKTVGIKPNNPFYKTWAWLNKVIYKKAYRIYTITDGMKKQVSQYVESDKVNTVPLWTGLSGVEPIEKSNNIFSIQYGFTDKFIVQYSGNIGVAHPVEVLVELAEYLSEIEDIVVVIIGRGGRKEEINNLVNEKGLKNCIVLPFQPEEMIKHSLSNAEVGVVMIEDRAAQFSVPSKIYNMMAVGSAVLAVGPQDAEVGNIVSKYENGAIFNRNDVESMAEYVLSLYRNEDLLSITRNNSIAASKDFTMVNAKIIFDIYEQ